MPKTAMATTPAERLRKLWERSGLSLHEVATRARYKGASSIQRYFDPEAFGPKLVPLRAVQQLEAALVGQGDPPITRDELYALAGAKPLDGDATARRSRRHAQPTDVRQLEMPLDYTEVDAIAGAGLGGEAVLENFSPDGRTQVAREAALAAWRFPAPYARAELGVSPEHGRIIKVVGDSMAPTLLTGDRVMIDTRDRRPSPGGLFALWDGLGVAVKRLDHIPNSDPPAVKILSDNPAHPAYERTADEINIIGRVVWFARRL